MELPQRDTFLSRVSKVISDQGAYYYDDNKSRKSKIPFTRIAVVVQEDGEVWAYPVPNKDSLLRNKFYISRDEELHTKKSSTTSLSTKELATLLRDGRVFLDLFTGTEMVYLLDVKTFVKLYPPLQENRPEDLSPSDRYKLSSLADVIAERGAYYIDDSKRRKVRVELLGVNVVVSEGEVSAFPGGYRGEQEESFFYIQDGELHARDISGQVIEAKDNYTLLKEGVLQREGDTIYSFSVPEFVDRFGGEFREWRQYVDSAQEELAIPESYFNLALDREITPLQRYLEVAAQVVLTPDAAVSFNRETEQVYGIYESLAGVYECLKRNDAEMVVFFARRLRPQSRSLLEEELLSGDMNKLLIPNFAYFRMAALRTLYAFLDLEQPEETLATPWQLYVEELAEGQDESSLDLDLFPSDDAIVQSLSYLISREKFWALNEAMRLNLPPQDVALAALASGSEDMIRMASNYARDTVLDALVQRGDTLPGKRRIPLYYFSALAQGCNSKLWTRLCDISREEPPKQSLSLLRVGYYLKVAVSERAVTVDYYNILRAERPLTHFRDSANWALNVDTAILLAEEGVSVKDIVKNNLGNVNLLLTLLPELSEEERQELKSESSGYALTFSLL